MKITGNNLTIIVDGAVGHFPEQFVKTAIEKRLSKKVIEQTEEDRVFIDYECPCCKTTLQQRIKPERRLRFHSGTIHKYKSCPYCGQALDWSDTE